MRERGGERERKGEERDNENGREATSGLIDLFTKLATSNIFRLSRQTELSQDAMSWLQGEVKISCCTVMWVAGFMACASHTPDIWPLHNAVGPSTNLRSRSKREQ